MSYVDAYYEQGKDIVTVIERVNGKRIIKEVKPEHNFYYGDPNGDHRSIFGEPVTEVKCNSLKDFKKNLGICKHNGLYESDIRPVQKVLERDYLNVEPPKLQTAFFDIEVDFDPQRGYSTPEDAFSPITSIGVYLQWMDAMICLAVPPKTLSWEQAHEVASPLNEVKLFRTEKEMLDVFLDIIEDADVLSGWNSESYDIPYVMNRITRTLGKAETRRMCLLKKLPKERKFVQYGKETQSFDLVGRVHLDYLELYRKYNYEERHSYRLDYIGEMEVGEKKVVYEGSLDRLYNHDFLKFLEYNIQDVMLLDKMDKKLQFIDLANIIAHENTVLLPVTMGAVATTEQAIINEAHRRGQQVPNRIKREPGSEPAAGAYVAYPKVGVHEWIGSMDLNSLYPSVIRSLNMDPATVIGQLRPEHTNKYVGEQMGLKKKSFAAAWEGRFGTIEFDAVMEKRRDISITVDWENGESDVMSGAQIHEVIFNSNKPWMISANGTIFTTEFEGVIPGLLKRWYSERKEMQAMKKKALAAENKAEIEFWDKRQLVKKINLNSLYGAILNPGCRFFDGRIGQSTTLTGRQIVKHMSAEVNKVITGEYNYVGKSIIYGDTDSVYFSAYPILKDEIDKGSIPWTKESVVQLYEQVCDEANKSFGKFMLDTFHCPKSRSDVIAAGREIVGESGLFITKKRYAILVYDDEGTRRDIDGKPGKVKAMGLDLRRSDTPVFMQEFLSEILMMVLQENSEKEILDRITEFRREFKERPGYEKGSPKRANKIGHYQRLEQKQGKANMPGHVRASINWNTLKRMNGDKYSQEIVDGMKVIVCKLRQNPLGYTSVAYPTDELRIPDWFKDLPFDNDAMEETIIDNKLGNLIGVLNYDLENTKQNNTFNTLFDFGE